MPEFTVFLPPDADIRQVITAAGGDPNINRYEADGLWYVDAPTRAALDAAAKAYDYLGDKVRRLRSARLALLADRRWRAETGGTTALGRKVSTTRDSQAMIASALGATEGQHPKGRIDFKTLDGWCVVTAAEMGQISQAVSDHVQTCFSLEKQIAGEIAAAPTVQAVLAVDIETRWPHG